MATTTMERPRQAEGEDVGAWLDRVKAWEVEVGQTCYRCRGIARILGTPGHRMLCDPCERLDKDADEVRSPKYIRCPKCRAQWNPYEHEQYAVFAEDVHEIACPECDHEFEVTTCITYEFESPELLSEVPDEERPPDEEEAEDEDDDEEDEEDEDDDGEEGEIEEQEERDGEE